MEVVVYHRERSRGLALPAPLRCLIVGPSGSGKTNLLLNFIYNKKGVPFTHLYLFSRSLDQPAYLELRKRFRHLEKTLGTRTAFFFATCDELISVEECRPGSLVVFDDCLMENQSKIKDYFVRGRHKRISCVYLSQSYGRVDMQVVRNNVNLLCAFSQNRHYTRRIFDEFVGSDMSADEFTKLCRKCWSTPHGFISIDVTRKQNDGKYKCMLDKPLLIQTRN